MENYKSVDDRFPFSDRFYYDFAGENEATEFIRKMFSPKNPRFERSSKKGINVVRVSPPVCTNHKFFMGVGDICEKTPPPADFWHKYLCFRFTNDPLFAQILDICAKT